MNTEEQIPFSQTYQSNRIRLIEEIPLEVPLCISIEPTNICNFKCQMCFQSTEEYKKQGGPFSLMEMDLFDKVLADIEELVSCGKKIKLIKLYSTGEPLLHPGIGEMLKRIKNADVCMQTEITSNASLLTEELSKMLVDYGLDFFRASIYAMKEENHKFVTQSKMKPEQIRKNLEELRRYRDEQGKDKPYICAKMFQDDNSDENEIFKELYKNISDEQFIDVAFEIPKLEENSLEKLYGGKENGEIAQKNYLERAGYKNRKACRYPFTHLTVRANGDVVVCCTDWSRDTKLGNVLEKSLKEIWNSRELYNFRVMQLTTKGVNHSLCATCEIPLKDCPEDDIDNLPLERLRI